MWPSICPLYQKMLCGKFRRNWCMGFNVQMFIDIQTVRQTDERMMDNNM